MSSPSNKTSPTDLPRYSTTAPPPYTSSDANSMFSTKSTSKSILKKMLNLNSTSQSSNQTRKETEENEARAAARAAYFSGL
ncbi:hypothetical protein AA0113_g3790 [Alternaria arborescens]|uniref:Uncharacterized protein n=1 Tax=Alternaria arborescens TaxID=156630 RepID=A0A4V1X7F1_9PLEO|nr:hypothetical protein AA0111_g9339 [Alternaria arborescens]RYN40664.1 hypothetical protein AA0112_g2542 [Alternaria arborescens]RYO22709.1 hypothetical protein AA0111_g9339 [Alternaria arborescens]RYO69768.1 hypothetical protein AA0113_g3790 [Alternaria arborescens]